MKPTLIVSFLCSLVFSNGAHTATAQEVFTATPIDKRALVTLQIDGYADFLAADGEAVWVTNKGRVEKLLRDRKSPVVSIPIPEPCGAMTVAFGSLWVANCTDSSLYRIDTATAKIVGIIPTGLADPSGELSVASGAGSVWLLTDRKGVLSRIDPTSNKVVAKIDVAPFSFAAAYGFGAVWISNTGPESKGRQGSVQRIDPKTNKVTATIAVGPVPRFLTTGEGGVWTLNQGDGSVTHIAPITNRVVASIPVGMTGGGGDIAAGGGRIWVRGNKKLLASVDPIKNKIVEFFGPPAGSGAVRVAGGLVWITAHDIGTVWVLRTEP
jgi:virginiamycin B lyase